MADTFLLSENFNEMNTRRIQHHELNDTSSFMSWHGWMGHLSSLNYLEANILLGLSF